MRRVAQFARTAALIVLLSLLGLEAGSRIMDGVPLLTAVNFVERDLDRTFNFVANVYDPMLGWRLADGLRGKSPTLTTGAHGLRMNKVEVRTPPTRAVLAVGDSFTAGSGVNDWESWPAQLEQLLGVPVNNGGVGGYGVDQIALRAEALVDALDPSLLLVGILSQDSLRNTYRVFGGGAKPYFRLQGGSATLLGVPVPRSIASTGQIGTVRAIFGHSYLVYAIMVRTGRLPEWVSSAHHYQQVYDDKAGPDISCAMVDRLLAIERTRHVRSMVVMQYGGGEILVGEPPWFVTPVVACARAKGIPTLDTFEPLKSIASRDPAAFKELYVMHDDGKVYGHMSARGNHLIATWIAAEMRKAGMIQ